MLVLMLLGAFLDGWEILIVLAVVLILFSAGGWPPFGGVVKRLKDGLKQGVDEFGKATNEVNHEMRKATMEEGNRPQTKFSFKVFIAQGFGIGLVPFAPGTFGSLLGLLWFAMLVATGNLWAYLAGSIEGIAFSIWLCDDAEKILDEKDPGSVVLDEIIAIPFCFLPWVLSEWLRHDAMPPVSFFFTGHALLMTLGIIVLFRVFDIWKPWPVRQIQRLPGGWGVTADDLLAAVYVMLGTMWFFL
jgi:phosphatidylglycerophosphatase A